MKGSLIALDQIKGRAAAALLVNGRLHDFLLDPASDVLRPGTILKGRVDRPLKGQGALMMQLDGGQMGYLREAAGLKPGQSVHVQVTSFVEDGKAVPVTTKCLYKGRYAIVTPDAPGINVSRAIKDDATRTRLVALAEAAMGGATEGLILRSAAEHAPDAAIHDDITARLDEARSGACPGPDAHKLAAREWSADTLDAEPGSFARHNVSDLIGSFAQARFELSGGAFAYIEQTRACITVDVNTGADTSPAAGLKANLALTRELSRQLLVRGLGGQVVIDFAPMAKKDRHILDAHFKTAMKADPVETALVGWTALGHYELQRKRERAPVSPDDLA